MKKKTLVLLMTTVMLLLVVGCTQPPATIDVTFVLNGGAFETDVSNTFEENSTPTIPDPKKQYYTFDGWFTDEALTDEWNGKITGGGALTLYAGWSPEDNVNFVLSGGEFETAVGGYFTPGSTPTIPDPSKAHHGFDGWFTDETLTDEWNGTIPAAGPITLYAAFSPNDYTVTLKLLGGSLGEGESDEQSYTFGDDIVVSELPVPTKEFSLFDGWFSDAALTVPFDGEDPAGNFEIFAKYKDNYGIVEIRSGGRYLIDSVANTAVTATIKIETGDTLDISATDTALFTGYAPKAGYEFEGWYVKNADDTFSLFDKTAFSNSVTDGSVGLILYANEILPMKFTNDSEVSIYQEITVDDEVVGYKFRFYTSSFTDKAFADITLTEITLPAYYQGLPVLQIDTVQALRIFSELTTLYFPNTVTKITSSLSPWDATVDAVTSRIRTINFQEGIEFESIFDTAFSYVAGATANTFLQAVNFPDNSITEMGAWFKNCTALNAMRLPEGLTTIGASAFNGCTALANIEFSSTITSIEDQAFFGCTELAMLTAHGLTGNNLPETLEFIGGAAFTNCAKLPSLVIWDGIEMGYNSFGGAFEGAGSDEGKLEIRISDIENITKNLGSASVAHPFQKMLYGEVVLFGLDEISNLMFDKCSNLTTITVFAEMKAIGNSAFSNTPIQTIAISTLAEDFTYGTSLFKGCTFTSFTIPEWMTVIPDNAFENCASLRTITFHAGIVGIGTNVFSQCTALEEINAGGSTRLSVTNDAISFMADDGLIVLFDYDLDGTVVSGLKEKRFSSDRSIVGYYNNPDATFERVVFAPEVTTIPDNAFRGLPLKEIIFEGTAQNKSQLQSIGQWAFFGHRATKIEFPDKENHISYNAATDEIDLDKALVISIDGGRGFATYNFNDTSSDAIVAANVIDTPLRIPAYLKEVDTTTFTGIGGQITFESNRTSLTSLAGFMFAFNRSETLAIPEGIQLINSNALSYMKNLKSITLPSTVNQLASNVFKGSFAAPSDSFAGATLDFSNNTFITVSSIGESVTAILGSAFANSNLVKLVLPSGDYTISTSSTFSGANYLEELIIGDCPQATLGSLPSASSSNLKKVQIGALKSISASSSSGYTKLESVVLGKITTFGNTAVFADCTYEEGGIVKPTVVKLNVPAAERTDYYYFTVANSYYPFRSCTIVDADGQLIEWVMVKGQNGNKLLNYQGAATTVTIPNTVAEIALCAFYNNIALTKVTVPASVVALPTGTSSNSIFKGCTALKEIIIETPEASQATKLTTIPAYTFYQLTALETVVISGSVTTMSAGNIFNGCTSLQTVIIGTSGQTTCALTTINQTSNFSNCYNLSAVIIYGAPDGTTIPAVGTNIGTNAARDSGGVKIYMDPAMITLINGSTNSNASAWRTLSGGSSTTGSGNFISTTELDEAASNIEAMFANLPSTVTIGDRANIEAVRETYDILSNWHRKPIVSIYSKLTDAETALLKLLIEELPATDAVTTASKDVIVDLLARYYALSESNQALITNSDKLFAAGAKLVTLLVEQLPNDTVTAADAAAIEEARGLYDALSTAGKALVTNYAKLVNLEPILSVVMTINSIPSGGLSYTTSNTNTMKSILNSYEELTADQKAAVGNYQYLLDSMSTYAQLGINALTNSSSQSVLDAAMSVYDLLNDEQKAGIDLSKAKGVDLRLRMNTLVAANITLEDEALVTGLRAEFDALNATGQSMVTSTVQKKLADSEAKIAELKNQTQEPTP